MFYFFVSDVFVDFWANYITETISIIKKRGSPGVIMQTLCSSQSIFIKVEGQCHSNHRSPQGVYKVEVIPEKTIAHSACAAIQVARYSVPFLSENPDRFTLTAFSEDGHEISIPRPLTTAHDHRGCFKGRSFDHPDTITIQ